MTGSLFLRPYQTQVVANIITLKRPSLKGRAYDHLTLSATYEEQASLKVDMSV